MRNKTGKKKISVTNPQMSQSNSFQRCKCITNQTTVVKQEIQVSIGTSCEYFRSAVIICVLINKDQHCLRREKSHF